MNIRQLIKELSTYKSDRQIRFATAAEEFDVLSIYRQGNTVWIDIGPPVEDGGFRREPVHDPLPQAAENLGGGGEANGVGGLAVG